ncbi:hypothetical protein QQX98_000717 [Neonectria punicea]|uniref:Uncharacterized protein n=1 Tax=Neonectria punicea TaxID=979145 RepID=A0ABR1HSC1_9HYPO
MSNHTKVDDGVVVTDTDVPPPMNWTNVYEDIGGDMRWSEGCEMEEEVRGRGLEGDIKPLYGIAPYTGEAMYLFEISTGGFFFYNAIDCSLYMIKGGLDLQAIVSTMDEGGMAELDVEEL